MSTDDLARLQRWEDAGAVWEVAALRPDSATISLLRCDAGEEVDRFVTSDPRVLALCRERW
ncbi:hypothetical protein L5G28_13885 [Gordonia sp. HY285]|uniref:Uncharacterized protein n=1 Tax=Gordonia liuliyuniae TaxID=2911517 RepID=A0ABS9IUN2_9ACTN|nr:hypothetical protein [Gordonia liuliyuniae]MCF8589275.1 hypothetical protein [Gordonia liuliyuniae]MCF8611237.1 hypothetical protein [Gordonia liuliyuniae]